MRIWLTDDGLQSNWETCSCGNRAEMEQICQGVHHASEGDYHFVLNAYKVLVCPACGNVNVIRYSRSWREFEDEVDGSSGEPLEREYTRDLLHSTYRLPMPAIPGPIADVYHQASSVLTSSPRAAFILCGAALEEICRSQGIQDTETTAGGKERRLDLYSRLEKLFALRSLPSELRRILHGIRDLRNLGAHGSGVSPVKMEQEDAEILLGLLQYVLERMYVDEVRAAEAQRQLDDLVKRVKYLPEDKKPSQESDSW